MNYECEIEEILLNELAHVYNIKDYNILFRYIYLRYLILNKNKNFGLFILEDELGITELTYKNEKINTLSGFDNSIGNILDNLFFTAKMKAIIVNECNTEYTFEEYIDITLKEIQKYSNNKSKKYKKDKYYQYYKLYYSLIKLNCIFNVTSINQVRKLNSFFQKDIEVRLSEEEKLNRYLHASSFNTNNVSVITEEILEEYIYNHLNEFEDGLKPISRQYIINEGRLDILAIDKNNTYVIIELKICNDKHLLWQVIYYPMTMKEILKTDNIRMITMCPSYPNYILNPLKEIKNIEIIEYIPQIYNNKINAMEYKKIK